MQPEFHISALSSDPNASAIIRVSEENVIRVQGHRLPFPAEGMRNYKEPIDGHIATGRRDASLIRELIKQHDVSGPVLDFACAAGRTLRWLDDYADEHETWGVDIDGRRISWCLEYLSPPFLFAAITTAPHLPFEDRFFSLIYGYSIFTHLDELFTGWLCEIRRCLALDGLFFATICDEESFQRQLKTASFVKRFSARDTNVARFLEQQTQATHKRFNGAIFSHIKRDYFIKACQPHFQLVDVHSRAMGVQTGLLFRRVR